MSTLAHWVRDYNAARAREDMGPEGLDVVATAGLLATVLCPEGHDVIEGFECPHSCKPGNCEGCPGRIS